MYHDDDRNQNGNETTTTKTYVGRYDEDRIGLYTSDLFRSNKDITHTATTSTGSNGPNNCTFRSVHVGIDLSIGGRVGTPVYAFIDGRIHSVGYNSDLGDYGNVLVVEHFWDRPHHHSTNGHPNNNDTTTKTNPEKVTVYALYGHLSDESILFKQENDTVRKGQIIGYIGNVYENGGWYTPHLHFQLSTAPPEQPHDMPGAICPDDRNRWLSQYLDPRYVLGALH